MGYFQSVKNPIFYLAKLILPLFLLSFIHFSCDVNETQDIESGTRRYEWELISLSEIGPNNLYTQLEGKSNNKVWIIGHAGDFNKTILIYNGTKVSNYGSLPLDPSGVFGIDSNEIWFTGSSFDIWKYNGLSIKKFSTHMLEDYYNSLLVGIWGNDKKNIYAAGSGTVESTGRVNGLIMHYDGNSWDYSIQPIPDLHFVKIYKGQFDDKYFLLGVEVKQGFPDSYAFYEFDGSSVKRFSLAGESNTTDKNIALLGNYVYLNDDKEIYEIRANKPQFYTSLKNTNVNSTQMWGRNEKDFFMQTFDGIGHYNGTDLETLIKVEGNFGIFDGLILESDVYFVGFYRNTLESFLIHGTKLE